MLSCHLIGCSWLVGTQGRKVERLSKELAMEMFGLDNLQLVRCEEANVKCLVAWGSGSLLLAFRGTANFTNALADIKVELCLSAAW